MPTGYDAAQITARPPNVTRPPRDFARREARPSGPEADDTAGGVAFRFLRQEMGGYRSRAAAEASLEVDVTVCAGHAGSCLVWVRNGRV
jgi:hypothetical protein